jgi:hypothetical protein
VAFLRRELQPTDQVKVGLHQGLIVSTLVGRVLKAYASGARLAVEVPKEVRAPRRMVEHHAFDWGEAGPEPMRADREAALGPEGKARPAARVLDRAALGRLVGRRIAGESPLSELRQHLIDMMVPLGCLPRLLDLARRGDWVAFADQLSDSVIEQQHGAELWAEIAEWLGQHAVAEVATEAATWGQMLAVAAFTVKGLCEIGHAHAAGRAQALAANYASGWAATFTAALIERAVPRLPATGDPDLDDARRRGRADALSTLGQLGPSACLQLARSLTSALKEESNIERALAEEVLRRAGYEGLVFHERSPVERSAAEKEAP